MKTTRMAHWLEIAREAINGTGGEDKAARQDEAARKFRMLVADEHKAAASTRPAGATTFPANHPAHPGTLESARPHSASLTARQEAAAGKGMAGDVTRKDPQPGSAFMRRKIRERYLDVRFPGTPHAEADLRNAAGVVKSARLYFEDGDVERATELLEFAGDANPGDEATALALLEILFLARRPRAFRDAALAYRERFPEGGAWNEIARLGAELLPGNLLFKGAAPAEEDPHDHYGAWPRVQNWIQAPFDLTGDVLAAEFHAKLRGGAAAPPITAKASGR
jgi:hypothetical protein